MRIYQGQYLYCTLSGSGMLIMPRGSGSPACSANSFAAYTTLRLHKNLAAVLPHAFGTTSFSYRDPFACSHVLSRKQDAFSRPNVYAEIFLHGDFNSRRSTRAETLGQYTTATCEFETLACAACAYQCTWSIMTCVGLSCL